MREYGSGIIRMPAGSALLDVLLSATQNAVRARSFGAGQASDVPLAGNVPFVIYLGFVVVSLLNLGVRWPWLGVARPTVVLVVILGICALAGGEKIFRRVNTREGKLLGLLFLYVLASLPFVTWPGSVLNANLEMFIRAAVFFFFTALFVDSEKRLKGFLLVYLACQTFRVLEPLYLHETTGYWGEKTHLGDGVFMGRLAGAPTDIIGANGLGFLIISILPFLFFWAAERKSLLRTIVAASITAPLLYALSLTSSRSGLVGLIVLVIAISFLVKRRLLFLGATTLVLFVGAKGLWSADQVARFAGLVGGGGAGGATAKGRIDGIFNDLNVWLESPIFGHGIGTSYEANFNVAGAPYISHNLYSEALVTLGIIGATIFFAFIYAIWKSTKQVSALTKVSSTGDASAALGPIGWLPKAMIALLAMCVAFSLSSYGVLEYYWYLFAGLAASLARLAAQRGLVEAPPVGIEDARRKVRGAGRTVARRPSRTMQPRR